MRKDKYKLIIPLFLIFIFNYSILYSQETWIQTYRPFQQPYMTDRYTVEDVLVTQDGGYIVSGSYELYDEFYYEHWGFLMKTDCDGNLLWVVSDSVDFMEWNENYAFVETTDGDLISIGYSYGGGYIIKRNSNGIRQWDNDYNDFGVNSMCKTLDGNITLGGRLYADAALRKMNNNGNTIWTKSYEIDSGSNAYSVNKTSGGGYLLAGKKYGEDNDILIIKTDSNGDSLWTRTFDGYGGNDQGNCIIETSDGNVIVVGEVHSRSIDTFIAKLSFNGSTIWSNIFSELAACYSITQSQDSNFVGYSWGGASTNSTHLFKIDNNQDFLWNRQLNCWPANGDKSFQELNNGYFICAGREHYRENIYLIKTDSLGQVTAIDNNEMMIINSQLVCYPNPVINSTTISFSTFNFGNIELNLYNIKGQRVKTLIDESICTGNHKIIWDGTDKSGKSVSSGTYFIKLQNGNNVSFNKMILIK